MKQTTMHPLLSENSLRTFPFTVTRREKEKE